MVNNIGKEFFLGGPHAPHLPGWDASPNIPLTDFFRKRGLVTRVTCGPRQVRIEFSDRNTQQTDSSLRCFSMAHVTGPVSGPFL
jgi:hypothetical protein